ncbi:hypothetical protein GCM10028862_10580 [Luteimonas pelagia]
MSFIAELRQRKVARVATAYLVVAWVAIEAASIALPAFEAPPWALRVLILLFALGFPLVLALTWALELTPDGVRVTRGRVGNKRMASAVAALVALAIGWYLFGQPAYRGGASAPDRSIAVLPFVNMSGDPANEYFSDGLAETTLDMLAQVQDLKVVARTSSFAFKGTNTDVREIGRRLDVAHLLEGSVQQAGDTVRITAQLVRTSDGSHVWSRRFDRRLADVFAIQDEIATEVVAALRLALPEEEQAHLLRRPTTDVAAYQAYMQGLALLQGRRVADMRTAVTHFEKALGIDPGFARAHAAAATALSLIDTYATLDEAGRQRRSFHVERALELAPDLGEAHVVRAAEFERRRELDAAEQAFRRGIALAPGYATGQQWFAEFLLYERGDVQGALDAFSRARALDPLSPVIRNEHAYAIAVSGRFDQALRENAALIADRPDFAAAHGVRAELLEVQGDLVGALRAMQAQEALDPDAFAKRLQRCRTLQRFGALEESRACAERVLALAPGHRFAADARSDILVLSGDFAGALAIVEQGDPADEWARAELLLANDRGDEARAILEGLVPELFRTPLPDLAGRPAVDSLLVAGALLQGDDERDHTHARRLLARQLEANVGRPHAQLTFHGRGWSDALAHALFGDVGASCDALREAVAAGWILDIPWLDVAPPMALVRADSCYAAALAPGRARTRAQVEAARNAGLL